MNRTFSDYRNNLILSAAMSILLGLALILFPDTIGRGFCYLAAAVLVLYGVVEIVSYFLSSSHEPFLVRGVLAVLVAGFLSLRPNALLSVLPFLLGVVVLLSGVMKLQSAIDLFRMHASRWWLVLAASLLTILFGVVVLLNPFAAAVTLMVFLGVSLVLSGLFDLLSVLLLNRRLRAIERAENL